MILVLGGTSDGLELAEGLRELDKDILYSAATAYGGDLADKSFIGTVVYGKKDIEELCTLMEQHQVKFLVDGTHPYAANVSKNAIEACSRIGVEYIRYERPSSIGVQGALKLFSSFEEAGDYANKLEGRIFITTGINEIERVLSKIEDLSRVVVRVLPWSESILRLERLGLNPDHIIAMKGPFSEEMNLLMFKESGAKLLISKDSGRAGGMREKLAAAAKLDMLALLVTRPEIEYPNKFETIEEIKARIAHGLELSHSWRL